MPADRLTPHAKEQLVEGVARGESLTALATALGYGKGGHAALSKRIARDADLANRIRKAERRNAARVARAERAARAKERAQSRTASDGVTQLRGDASMRPELLGAAVPRDDPAMSPAAPTGYRQRRSGGGRILCIPRGEGARSRDEECWLLARGKTASAEDYGRAQMEADGLIYGMSEDGRDRGWVETLPEGWVAVAL